MASPNQNWKPLHLSDGQVLYVSKRDDIWFRNNQTGNVGLAVSPAIGTFTADATGLVTIRGRKAAGNVAINITADAGEIDIITPNYITLSSGEDCTLTLSSSRTHSGTAINITAPGVGADILVTAGHNITLTATGIAQVAGTSTSKLTSGSSNVSASPTGIGVLSGGSINITSNSAAIAIASQGGTITLNAGTAGTVAITGNSSPNFTIFGESFHPETGATNGNVISRVAGVWQGVTVASLGLASSSLTSAHILVGSAGGVATDVAMSGDVTIGNTGVTAIGAAKVTNAMLAGSIDLTTKVTGTLPVGNGGTGIASPTAHKLLVGNGASAMTQLAVGTTDQVLLGASAADPAWTTLTGDVTISAGATVIGAAKVLGSMIASSVALAGSPTTTTQAALDNSTKVSTTAYVDAAITASGATTHFTDNTFDIKDDGDATKKLAFQLSGITTGNTRTLTVPDSSGTILLTAMVSSDITMTTAGVTTIKSSVSLAGSPTTTTQSQRDNSTKIATTAYVDRAAGDSAWTTYTPAIIQSAVVASANTAAGSSQFKLIGKTMFVTVDVKPSATGTATAAIQIGLPSSADSPAGSVPTNQDSSAGVMGFGQFALGGTVYRGLCLFSSVSGVTPLFSILRTDTTINGAVGAVAPTAAITSSDRLLANLTYQVN